MLVNISSLLDFVKVLKKEYFEKYDPKPGSPVPVIPIITVLSNLSHCVGNCLPALGKDIVIEIDADINEKY